jgi:hypothetical protein
MNYHQTLYIHIYNQVLGFGLMNAGAMVTQAKQWTTVPSQQACATSTRTMSMYVDCIWFFLIAFHFIK